MPRCMQRGKERRDEAACTRDQDDVSMGFPLWRRQKVAATSQHTNNEKDHLLCCNLVSMSRPRLCHGLLCCCDNARAARSSPVNGLELSSER
jgi:hypothetical protein